MPRAKKETVQEEPVKTEETKKAAEPKQEAPAAAFTIEQVQQMIADAIKKHDAEKAAKEPETPFADAMVTMFFQAEVNDANEIPLGPNAKYGYIIGKHAKIGRAHV